MNFLTYVIVKEFFQAQFCILKNKNMWQKIKKNSQLPVICVQINTKNCTACWKCLEACKNNVIGRINLPWHKHAKIIHADNCTACLRCVKVCESDAVVY